MRLHFLGNPHFITLLSGGKIVTPYFVLDILDLRQQLQFLTSLCGISVDFTDGPPSALTAHIVDPAVLIADNKQHLLICWHQLCYLYSCDSNKVKTALSENKLLCLSPH